MKWMIDLFGEGKELTMLQMSVRGISVFIIALVILRLAGQKTFGQRSATDNVIVIMLGAILSRAVTGASSFLPVIAASLVIVLFHRLLAWICVRNKAFDALLKGEKKSLYKNGKINDRNMKQTLLNEYDLMEGVRLKTGKDTLASVEEIYLEVNGEISTIRKDG